MNASQAAVQPGDRSPSFESQRRSLLYWVERFSPEQGWDSFALMLAAVSVAAWTVREANWVRTPGLFFVIFVGSATGLVFAKIRLPSPLLHVIALMTGALVIVWQTTWVIPGGSGLGGTREVWDRTFDWFAVAQEGGINTDLLPATLFLLGIAWVLGYVSAWPLFRNSNVWIGIVIGGVAVLTTLSFLPEGLTIRFFLFLLLALLLIARITTIHRRAKWREENIGSVSTGRGRWLAATAIIILSAAVLAGAAGAPLKVYISKVAIDVWNKGRAPISGLEDDFARMFSGITSKKDVDGRFFGTTLPFQGKISFGGEVVMLATSPEPAYWLSRTYSQYSSEGWIAGATQRQDVGPEGLPPPPHESGKRDLAFQRVLLTFDSDDLFAGGNVDWISHDAVVETLRPMTFKVDVRDPSRDSQFPPDVQDFADKIRGGGGLGVLNESSMALLIPDSLVLLSVEPKGATRPDSVTLARKEPETPDVTTWKFADRLPAEETYTMYTFVSEATGQDLRQADEDYHPFVTDHYLQLPDTLPERVKNLAGLVTERVNTPLDKALVIQDYLRDEDRFTYSQDIERPPQDSDGVDNFLFETKTGYSDYFASAMAVMLRAVGVPARLAAGYAPGENTVVRGQRQVRDSDSHGWVQAYFPGHGWIDFEPTPHWPIQDLGGVLEEPEDAPTESEIPAPSPLDIAASEEPEIECLSELDDPEDIDDPAECQDMLGGLPDEDLADPSSSPASLATPLVVILAVIAGIWLIGWLLWSRGLGNTPSERTYTKMTRLGMLAGIFRRPYHTPTQYAGMVGTAIPAVAGDARNVAWSFSALRYSNREADGDGGALNEGWKRIRGGLLVQMFKRLLPIGGAPDESA